MLTITLILVVAALAITIGHMVKGWPLSIGVLLLVLVELLRTLPR
jgi:hypothetical protein